MTAPDPRVGEIQARLAKVPGAQGLYSFHGADIAYLLAELRDRDEKLAKVEAECAATDTESGEALQADLVARIRAAVAAAGGGGE